MGADLLERRKIENDLLGRRKIYTQLKWLKHSQTCILNGIGRDKIFLIYRDAHTLYNSYFNSLSPAVFLLTTERLLFSINMLPTN